MSHIQAMTLPEYSKFDRWAGNVRDMATIYRPVNADEEAEVMRLWTTVFGDDKALFQSNQDSEPNRQLHQTLVAHDGERIVSTVQYFNRHTRMLDGTVQKMGAIANVATFQEARKQGHSGKLLELAIDWMRKDGCTWSQLFTGVNAHYERYGWKTIQTRYREGTLASEAPVVGSWRVVPVNPRSDSKSLAQIAQVYDVYNANRPLTHVRTMLHWEKAVMPRMMWTNGVTYTACEGDCSKVSAYVVCKTNDDKLFIQEIGYIPGGEDAVNALMALVHELAVHRNVQIVRAHLPFEPVVNDALGRLVSGIETGYYRYMMARSLVDSLSQEDVEKPFAMDGPHFWPLDDF
jgi:predicted acetyltransferase